ncbi:trimeric intracellular cation channel family protein [Roseomonas sp. OT10]|uniref:trimeric intracellular cation channel family protein n=1 Tax=Roseomonas cutis TaxID=2897332 RepID=UPI001E4182E2|nr:trimeric intracellular cation channel family protein [Roseomonas sp. OT10]UFN48086.1 trimeric intracellular cation channel family protein [Roseomonas sp. OT10]
MPLDTLLAALSWAAVAVLAVAGALTASRKQLDPVGFILVACVTAFGGGSLRDLLLGKPVFWLETPGTVALASALALLVFFTAHRLERRFTPLLWADAVGLALFAVLGAEAAHHKGASPWACILLGMVTATFGRALRDVLCQELPLILRREIYATAAALGAGIFIGLTELGLPRGTALLAGAAACFSLRATAILRGWSLPTYNARPGRNYPDRPRN